LSRRKPTAGEWLVVCAKEQAMTLDKDRKRVIRERMTKTGESYTAARAQILSRPTPREPRMSAAVMAERAGMADATIKARTGRSWPEWVRALDADNASTLPHRDIARLVRRTHGVGDWWSQSVTVGYERIKGLRERGQRRGGAFEANKSKTFNHAVATVFRAWSDARARRTWLGVDVKVRTATAPKTIRLQWPDGTIVIGYLVPKGAGKTQLAVTHTKLTSKAAAETAKAEWTERLAALGRVLD
jgi:hypothetical protein